MNWSRLADLLDRALTTPLSLPEIDGAVYVADTAPGLYTLLEEVAETEADRGALDREGWGVIRGVVTVREVLSFDFHSMVGGGAIIWWLLEGGDGRRYLVYEADLIPAVVFARLEGDPAGLVGPVIERFFATNGEAFGIEEAFVMLPECLNNAAPALLPEASVHRGARAFMEVSGVWYGGWADLSRSYPDPQTPEQRDAAFADYWRRSYIEV